MSKINFNDLSTPIKVGIIAGYIFICIYALVFIVTISKIILE